MFQWLLDKAIDGKYKKVTYSISMNTIYACFVCPHENTAKGIYWNDFGYNVTNTSVELRCCPNDNILIIGI